eukprot:405493-Rhodomonas_salina.1
MTGVCVGWGGSLEKLTFKFKFATLAVFLSLAAAPLRVCTSLRPSVAAGFASFPAARTRSHKVSPIRVRPQYKCYRTTLACSRSPYRDHDRRPGPPGRRRAQDSRRSGSQRNGEVLSPEVKRQAPSYG